MLKHSICLLVFLIAGESCGKKEGSASFPMPQWSSFNKPTVFKIDSALTYEMYLDKLLGSIVGSAIGDAMGAPTEGWNRKDISATVGFVDSLDIHMREGGAEGPWEDWMPGGSTTDDTRWKYITYQYLMNQGTSPDSLDSKKFAGHLIQIYERQLKELSQIKTFDPEPIEKKMLQINFLQEWAKVSKPYIANDMEGYTYALNKFYGGEMVCAGMLYAPLIGAYFPSSPVHAYTEAYRLGIYDIGYGRDITGLTAALVSEAMKPGVTIEQIMQVCKSVDPLRFINSRLTGRISYQSYKDALYISDQVKDLKAGAETKLPIKYAYSPDYYVQVQKAYELLDKRNKDFMFHSAEIHVINLTGLIMGQGDFLKTMEFVINYGRDNDTVGAVTGAIMGAYCGFNKIPIKLREQVIKTNKEIVGIDLMKMAEELAAKRWGK
ncbi:MAG: ADP-ribosylglycohydrolase family protein [Saprospiraceae bacterium]